MTLLERWRSAPARPRHARRPLCPTLIDHLFSWPIAWAASFLLVTIAFFYLRGWLRLRNSFPNVIPPWRLAALIGGLLSVWTAAISPIAMLDHRSLTIHMVKHLLLMTVAAPLVLSGKPVLPLLYGISRRGVGSDILLGNRSAKWLERSFAHPWLCWLAASTVLIGWHLPVAFQLAQRFEWIHGIEDASFFLAGLLFWWPVMPALPSADGRLVGPWLYTFFWPRCLATSCPRSWYFVTALFTPAT